MGKNTSQGQCRLVEQVIEKGICVTCGACVGLCPYFSYYDGKVMVMDKCQSDTWRCLQLCPRSNYEGLTLDEAVTGTEDSPLGHVKEIMIARSQDSEVRKTAQYGGVVSSLLIYALEKGYLKRAVLTDSGNELAPGGVIAETREEILRCTGSRYTASGSLAALNRAIKSNFKEIAVVGVPCQMEALERLGQMTPDGADRNNHISLRIGLFCTWALDFRGLKGYLDSLGIPGPIKKYDIPPPPAQIFKVLTDEGWKDLPLDDIRPFVQKGCTLCEDMTAKYCDLSVGTAEGMDGWNTVIVRSPLGSEIIQGALKEGFLQSDSLPRENLEHLEEAARNKRKRGVDTKEGQG